MERYPAHAVAKWLGHSPKVAAEHYLMSREHHFEDVVNGCVPEENRSGEGQGSPSECDAKCASIATRNATPQASASGSTEPHKTPEPAATTRVTTGSSGIVPVIKTGPVGSTGFEAPSFFSEETADSGTCSADCSALPPDLARLVAAWDQLPPAVQAGILAMVKASGG